MTDIQHQARMVSQQLNRLQSKGLGASGALLQARLLAAHPAYRDVIKINEKTGRITITTKKQYQGKVSGIIQRLTSTYGYKSAEARESQARGTEKKKKWEERHGLGEKQSDMFERLRNIPVVRKAIKNKEIPSEQLVPLIKAIDSGTISAYDIAWQTLVDIYERTGNKQLGDWLEEYESLIAVEEEEEDKDKTIL